MKDQVKSIVVGFACLAVLLGIVWIFVDRMITSLARLQSAVAGSIVAATIAAIAAFLVNVYIKHREAKERVLQEIRIKKTPVYEELIELIFSVLMAEKLGKKAPAESEIVAKIAGMTPKVVIWASEDVVTKWNDVRTYVKKSTDTPLDQFTPWNNLLRAIRKDLGHGDQKLERWALLRLFVNDLPPPK
jgi:hypothetical protein